MKAKLFAVVLSLSFLSNYCIAANVPETKSTKPSQQIINKKININTANSDELSNSFKGIGQKRAENIVQYRKDHGNYKAVSDLANVKGIGQNFVERNMDELNATFSVE